MGQHASWQCHERHESSTLLCRTLWEAVQTCLQEMHGGHTQLLEGDGMPAAVQAESEQLGAAVAPTVIGDDILAGHWARNTCRGFAVRVQGGAGGRDAKGAGAPPAVCC
jgi:hypothetical protein